MLLTPGSALYGTDAVSGVINIITREPSAQAGQKQSFTYEGSESSYQHGQLLLHGDVGARPLVVGAHTETFNNQRVAKEYPDVYALGDLKDSNGVVVIPASQRNAYRSKAESSSVWGRLQWSPALEAGAGYRAVRYPNDATTRPQYVNYGGSWGERQLNLYLRHRQGWSERLESVTLLDWSTYRLDPDSHFNNLFSNYQPGYKYAESQRLQLDSQWSYHPADHHALTAYHSQLDNLILFARNTAVPVSDFIPGGFLQATSQNVNLGQSVASGVEGVARLRFPARRGAWESWAACSYTDGRLNGPDGREPLPYTARSKLKLGGTWRSHAGWFVSPSWLLSAASRVPGSASKTEPLTTPGYGLLNLFAGWDDWRPGVSLSLRLENVGDRRYYHAGGTSRQSLIRLPQPGRTLTLGAELAF